MINDPRVLPILLYLIIGGSLAFFSVFVAWDTAIEKRDEPTIRGMIFLCFFWPIVAIGFAILLGWERLKIGGRNDRH